MRFLVALPLLALAACGPSHSPNSYKAGSTQQVSKVEKGTIVSYRKVEVEGGSGRTGALAGAAAGGIGGSAIGGDWRSNLLMGIGGAVVGGLAGGAIEKEVTETTAYEYIVRDETGGTVAIVQKEETPLAVGSRVLVIRGAEARIIPDTTN